jgi:DNA repair exonuclease SbcCD ATPase subunit
LLVELYFEIGKKQYYVKRGIKPHIFEIYEDNKLLNQDPSIRDYQKVLEQQIIKMNYRAFTQVVIMGSSSYTPFMRLKTNDRREFIEDLLDIRVFSVMNALLKEKMKNLKEDVRDVEVELKSLREKAALQDKHVKSRKQEKKDTLLLLSNEIEVLIAENDRHQAACDDLMQDSSGLQTQTEKYENTSERMGEVKALHRRIEDNIKKHREKREFYDTVEHCPTCKQTIEDRHKTNIIGTVDEQITSLETDLQQLQVELSKVHADMQIYEDLSMKLNEINSEINKHNKMIMVNNALIESKKVQIIAEQDNTSNVDEEIAILKEYAKAIVAKSDKKKEIIELQQYQTACSVFLQDNGIKAKIIKQYIPIINKLINKYLDAMDFFVGFHLDENFNEIIKSRHRDTFSYESFSDGQKRRIDAALLLTWRDVAKSKNSVNTNLIFFDEFDAPLDGGGADMLMDLYKASNIQNVFIISHKEGLANHADRILRFEMNNNFTILKDD